MKHLPSIMSHTIPHNLQQYDTAGDYWQHGPWWFVRVSEMGDWRHEALVFIHEFVEMCLTTQHGIDWKDIDQFDKYGEGKDHPDPGTLESAPYHNEHMLAVQMEKKFAKLLRIDWEEYDKSFDKLEYQE